MCKYYHACIIWLFYQHKITFILKRLSLLFFTCSTASVYKTDTITHTGPPSAVMAEAVQPSTITLPLLMFIQGSPVLGSLTKSHIKHFHAEYLPAVTTVPIKARFHTSSLLAMHSRPFQEFRWYFFFAWDGPEWWAECLGCFLPWQHRAGNILLSVESIFLPFAVELVWCLPHTLLSK